VHSINTIAWAIRFDGRDQLQERLHGLHWQWIPYVLSGIPLAGEIEKAVARAPETDIFVLGNHGLVVCGDDCDAAEELLREVERRLAITPRPAPGPDNSVLGIIAGFSRWQYPDCDLLHALGTDEVTLKILRGGVLHPCQAIFLGRQMLLLPPTFAVSKFREHLEGKDSIPPFVAVERSGVMLNEQITSAQRATLLGLVQITQRTGESAQLRYLSKVEVKKILSWCAHGYKDEAETGKMASSSARIENKQRKPSCNQNPCFS
jgi:rhamnose utilization protein RhaD (predicted bifunctional aldolase and dehydrogenase)